MSNFQEMLANLVLPNSLRDQSHKRPNFPDFIHLQTTLFNLSITIVLFLINVILLPLDWILIFISSEQCFDGFASLFCMIAFFLFLWLVLFAFLG